jgi:histidinol-phosphate aminotransferase
MIKQDNMAKKNNNIDIRILARPSVIDLKPYASAKDEFKDFERELIYVDANENPYENGMNRYPDPNQKRLRKKISEIKNVPFENILLGNGSDEVLDLIFRVFMEPGIDNIVISVPTFGMFRVLCGVNDIECREARLDSNFQLQTDRIRRLVDEKTKAIFICSPNNPTGNLMRKEDILNLLDLGLLVVVDEAYTDFAMTGSMTSLIETYPNLIVTQTFSKAYGMAGIRLGMCFAQEPVIELLKKVKMPYNVNVLTQNKALEQLSDQDSFKRQVEEIISNRGWLRQELSRCEVVKEIYPSDSNFLLLKVDDADRRYKQLIAKGLVVRNRSKEPLCENCLRITIGTTEENQKLVRVMQNFDVK